VLSAARARHPCAPGAQPSRLRDVAKGVQPPARGASQPLNVPNGDDAFWKSSSLRHAIHLERRQQQLPRAPSCRVLVATWSQSAGGGNCAEITALETGFSPTAALFLSASKVPPTNQGFVLKGGPVLPRDEKPQPWTAPHHPSEPGAVGRKGSHCRIRGLSPEPPRLHHP